MIRKPDEYRTERLTHQINHSNTSSTLKDISYVEQMKLAIEISKQDYNEEMEQIEEQQIIEFYLQENKEKEKNKEKRENEVSPILVKLKRLSKFDKELIDLYIILEEIFTQYINYHNFNCLMNEETINNIWKSLNQIRFTQEEKDILHKIIKS
jgi:hypothetical protein